ncbi:acetylcholinesterase-1-like [Amblyomma americanum]
MPRSSRTEGTTSHENSQGESKQRSRRHTRHSPSMLSPGAATAGHEDQKTPSPIGQAAQLSPVSSPLSNRRTSMAARCLKQEDMLSPGSFSEGSPYFASLKAHYGSPLPPVSSSSPTELQLTPNTLSKITEARRMSRSANAIGALQRDAVVSSVSASGSQRREEEETLLDKVLERHVVDPKARRLVSHRGRNKLILYAVLLVIILLIAGLVLFTILAKTRDTVQVDAAWGSYRGSQELVEGGLECYSFLGIPFGNATGGALRFQRPQKAGHWMHQTASGSAPCLQQPVRLGNFSVLDAAEQGSEDCLRLNLWTPSITAKDLSVLLFLHGFQFYYGSNSQDSLRGELLSALGNLVVVVPNYRLGPLGFLSANASEAPGNLALYDQRLALDWTRENVRYFGGDPSRLVLHGYEAGAVSVGYHLLSPLDHWVKSVRRLILQSGSALRLFKNNTSASQRNVRALELKLKCRSLSEDKPSLDCLREVAPGTFAQPVTHTDFVFGPSFNSEFLPSFPSQLLPDAIHSKDVLLGTVSGEGVVLAELYVSRSRINLSELLSAYGVLDAPQLVALYASQWDNRTGTLALAKQILGDVLFSCPVQYLAEQLSSSNNRVHNYVFVHKPSFSAWADPQAAQYEDLDFVFGVPLRRGLGTPEEQALSRRLIQLVAAFAKDGALPRLREGGEWPEFHGLDNDTVEITLNGFSLASVASRAEQCRQIRPHLIY